MLAVPHLPPHLERTPAGLIVTRPMSPVLPFGIVGVAKMAQRGFTPGGGGGPPTIENGSGNGEFSNSDTVSCTVTLGNRLAFAVMSETSDTTDSVAYGAQSLTQIGSAVIGASGGNFARVSWWELVGPTPGTANVVATTSGGTIRIGVWAASLVGAGAAVDVGGDFANATDTVASVTGTAPANNSLVLDAIAVGNNACEPVYDGAQTEHLNADSGGGSTADRCNCSVSSKVAAAGSVTMSASLTDASSLRHAMMVIAFPPL